MYVLAAEPTKEDESPLPRPRARADRRGPRRPRLDRSIPFNLATDIVRVPSGSGFPLDDIARSVAARIARAFLLAARLPALRDAVCRNLIEELRLAGRRSSGPPSTTGRGHAGDHDRPARPVLENRDARRRDRPGAAARGAVVIGNGLAFRTRSARQLLALVPVGGWAVKGCRVQQGRARRR